MSEKEELPHLSPGQLAAKLADSIEVYEGLFAPLLVVGWDTGIRDHVLDDVAARLPGVHLVRIAYPSLGGRPLATSLAERMAEVPPDKQPALALLDAEAPLIPGDTRRTPTDAAARLNSLRDTLAQRFAFPWIIWLTNDGFKDLAIRAPDFFDFRRHVFWVDEAGTVKKNALPRSDRTEVEIEARLSGDKPDGQATSRIAELGRLAEDLERTSDSSPASAQALVNTLGRLTEAYLEAGNVDQAAVTAAHGVTVARQHGLAELLPGMQDFFARVLARLGRREEALAAAQEAAELYRTLAQSRPEAFRPYLAGSLNNLGIRLSELGQHEEALAAAQEAAALYRSLAQSRPKAFLSGLAMSLNNLANRLSDLGQREEALVAAQEVAEQYRALDRDRPEVFRSSLALSLNNLANKLSDLGQREEALAAAQEAVELYRALARSYPEAFRPKLAMSLNNLAKFLSDLGQREEALAAAQEAARVSPI